MGITGWALQLKRKGIAFKLVDNAFTEVGDWERAQKISDGAGRPRRLHGKLDAFARRFCPIFKHFGVVYHWSLDQAEYATDVVFKRQSDLAAIYDNLTRTAIHTVKPDNIATFLGAVNSTVTIKTKWETASIFESKAHESNTPWGASFYQNVRQVLADPAHRNDGQRRLLF
jgi:hypothetical protein